jgi:hypothetical protein
MELLGGEADSCAEQTDSGSEGGTGQQVERGGGGTDQGEHRQRCEEGNRTGSLKGVEHILQPGGGAPQPEADSDDD